MLHKLLMGILQGKGSDSTAGPVPSGARDQLPVTVAVVSPGAHWAGSTAVSVETVERVLSEKRKSEKGKNLRNSTEKIRASRDADFTLIGR